MTREEVTRKVLAAKRAKGNVKLALLLLEGCEPQEAAALLDRSGGRLHAALAARHPAKRR